MENIVIIDNNARLGEFVSDLAKVTIVSLDIETSELNTWTSKLLLIQMKVGEKIFIVDCTNSTPNLIKYIISMLKDSNKLLIGHNIKFDIKKLFYETNEMLTNVFDTMLAEVLLTQGIGSKFPSLADIVLKYCDIELDKSEREKFFGATEVTQAMIFYGAKDVLYLEQLYYIQTDLLSLCGQDKVADLEMKLIAPVADMEMAGVPIDSEAWIIFSNQAKEKYKINEKNVKELIFNYLIENKAVTYENCAELFDKLYVPIKTKKHRALLQEITELDYIKEHFIDNFNVGSHVQMKSALHLLGIDVRDTNEKTLKNYLYNDVVKNLLLFREFGKKVSTYGEKFLENINQVTSRIHAEFNQLTTDTGRFSSSNPNMQNIPKNDKDNAWFYRSCFKAPPGKKFITADFSQQELRILGAISGEPRMINAYANGQDLHALTASIIYNVPIEEVTKEQRSIGKSLNFATVYGTTAKGLSYNFNIRPAEAERLLANFWKGYPVFAKFVERAHAEINKRLYSITPLGRIRYFEKKDLYQDGEILKEIAKRQREGFNHIAQGGGADVTKISCVNYYYSNPYGRGLILILAIHDELVFEVDENIALEAKEFVKKCMIEAEQPFLGSIPAEVDVKISDVWGH